jgi:hypothetical protein
MCVLGDGANGIESALTGDGILLAGKLLLEKLNSPAKKIVRDMCLWWGRGGGVRDAREKIITYFVGASASSMSPLMKVAMALAAELIWSCSLEMVNLPRSSSRALTALEFSDLTAAASWRAAGAMLSVEVGEGGKRWREVEV